MHLSSISSPLIVPRHEPKAGPLSLSPFILTVESGACFRFESATRKIACHVLQALPLTVWLITNRLPRLSWRSDCFHDPSISVHPLLRQGEETRSRIWNSVISWTLT